jgi:hypothetical protein
VKVVDHLVQVRDGKQHPIKVAFIAYVAAIEVLHRVSYLLECDGGHMPQIVQVTIHVTKSIRELGIPRLTFSGFARGLACDIYDVSLRHEISSQP